MFTLMRRLAITMVLAGCQNALGLEEPVLQQPDAGAQNVVDVPEAPVDAAAQCPAAPAGCTAFACAATDSCYYACSGHATWVAAQSYCTQIADGCLATITGELEQQCVVAATQPTSSDPVWIGLYQLDAAHEPGDGWQWTCGDSAWRSWAAYEPYELVGDRDCGELAGAGGWKAEVCGYSRRFVCKVDVR
jgi:hypothetical protein